MVQTQPLTIHVLSQKKILNYLMRLIQKHHLMKKNVKAFYDWQEYAIDEAFVIPTLYRNEVLPVNDRVVDFTWAVDTKDNPWATVGVTADSRK